MLDNKYTARIDKLDPAQGLRSITYLNSDDVLEVETDEQGIIMDFDTYEDYKKEFHKT